MNEVNRSVITVTSLSRTFFASIFSVQIVCIEYTCFHTGNTYIQFFMIIRIEVLKVIV